MSNREIRPFRLNGWDIYPASGEIACGGQKERLEPRAMAVLCALAAHPDRTLSREELVDDVWQGEPVTDDAITRVIYKLRQTLGDDTRQPRYIQTLPKRGYRLVAEPQPLSATPKTGQAPKSTYLGLFAFLSILGAVVVFMVLQWGGNRKDEKAVGDSTYSIAVLPFEDFRTAPPDDHLADVITDELLNGLANLKQLRVVARTSIFSLRDNPGDIRDIGRSLNVKSVVEGSIRRSGDKLRLIIQLIDVESGYHLLSETIERHPDDLFNFTAQAVPAITQALGIPVNPQELARATAVPSNSEVQRITVQGRFHWHRRNEEAVKTAQRYFEQAIALAPDYAPAYAGLADALVFSTQYGSGELSELSDRARKAAERALQLDPGLPDGHASLGLLNHHLGRYDTALQHLEQAIALNPNHAMAHMWSGRSHFAMGRFNEAMLAYQRSAALDPIAPIIHLNVGMAAMLSGHAAEAEAAYKKSIEFNPDNLYARWALAYLLWSKGELRDAERLYANIIEQGLERADVIAQAAIVAIDLSNYETAKKRLDRANALDADNDWSMSATWSYLVAHRRYDQLQAIGESSKVDHVARAGLAKLLDKNIAEALAAYTALMARGEEGEKILFDKWDMEWGFSHALYLLQTQRRSGDKLAAVETRERLETFFDKMREQGLRTPGTDYVVANLAALSDQPEQALAHLKSAVERGWSKLWWLEQDPAFDTLRSDPRYLNVINILQARIEAKQ